MGGLPAGFVTFLITDIEGSTRLHQFLGAGFPGVLDRHNTLIAEAVARHSGQIVQTTGDGVFAVFASAPAAVRACADAQRALAAEPWPDGVTVGVRMGLHSGDAQPDGAGYTSLAVHEAARICAAAHGTQVLVSGTTAAAARADIGDLVLRDLGEFQLR